MLSQESPREVFQRRLRDVVEDEIEKRRDARSTTSGNHPPKVTQKTIAEECGISYKALNSYIRECKGSKEPCAIPRGDQLVLLARELNVSLDYLFGLSEVRELNYFEDTDALANAGNNKIPDTSGENIAEKINAERRKVSNYTGLSSAAMDTLNSYVRTKRHLSMLNTVNWLLESVDMGSMFPEYEALGSCDYPTHKIPYDGENCNSQEPPSDLDSRFPETTDQDYDEYVKFAESGGSKESLRRMTELLIGSSVLQLIDSYLHSDLDSEALYDITEEGRIYDHAKGRDGDMIPIDELRSIVLGSDLVENFYLEQIKKALHEMKHKTKPPV